MILHGPDEETHAAIGALGLAAASVSVIVQYCPNEIVLTFLRLRGHLTLVATGTLTIATAQVFQRHNTHSPDLY